MIKRQGLIILILALGTFLGFQNCSQNFKVQSSDSTTLDNSSTNSPNNTLPNQTPVGPTSIALPTPPNQLNLVAASPTQINLNWVDNSNNETGFRIERAYANTGPFILVITPSPYSLIATTSANVVSYIDNNLQPGTLYYYRVSAINASGASTPSSAMSLTTPVAPVSAPSPPSGLTTLATAASIATLNWSDNSNNESYFKIERSSNNGATFTIVATTSANISTYQDFNLIEQSTYLYRVSAVNSAGGSNATANVAVTTLPAGNKASYSYLSVNVIGPNCASCHMPGNAAAGINVATYNTLLGLVVSGNSAASTLYTVTASGKMPPGGQLSADQLNSIKLWINAGAPNN